MKYEIPISFSCQVYFQHFLFWNPCWQKDGSPRLGNEIFNVFFFKNNLEDVIINSIKVKCVKV